MTRRVTRRVIRVAVFFDKPRNPNAGIKSHCERMAALLNSSGEFQVSLHSDIGGVYIKALRKYVYGPRALRTIHDILTRQMPDYVEVNGFMTALPAAVIRAARKKKIPVVYQPHMHPFYTLNHPALGRAAFALFLKPLLKQVDKIVTINNEEYAFFKKYNERCCLIPHWITHPVSDKRTRKPQSLLFVGRNDANKNLAFLYNLPERVYTVTCVTNKKPERDDFIYLNNVDDAALAALYDQASLVVVPSRYEAFSLVAMEALSHGTPVLVSDRVRIADYLTGVSGCTVFRCNDAADFLAKIDTAQGAAVDLEKAARLFSGESALEKYRAVFAKRGYTETYGEITLP